MRRKITDNLVAWKDSPNRMPLLLNGARQAGKTYTLEQFGKAYFDNVVYLNMEIESVFCKFLEDELSPGNIIRFLEAAKGQEITAGKTLIFFDEIQACERALTSLKYFCEQAPEYHVVAAGSLLGVAINQEKYSFPVGKVNEMNMYPLDFEEFLWAMNREKLAEEIRTHYAENRSMPEALHRIALELYQKYSIVGGMPAAAATFMETDSFLKVQSVQNNILNEYIADMAKYSDSSTSIKIRACYNSIPAQLAKENKKFQYKTVQRGGTATIFGEAIEWLNFAGIVLKCQKLNHGMIPIAAYGDLSDFKLYMGDVGMLTMKSGMPLQMILTTANEDNIFLGALAENYVAQALSANRHPLYYWKNEHTAEVDFVLQQDDKVIPIEVKKGLHTRSKSLGMFISQYACPYAIRISQKNFGFENSIKSIPLYAVFCI